MWPWQDLTLSSTLLYLKFTLSCCHPPGSFLSPLCHQHCPAQGYMLEWAWTGRNLRWSGPLVTVSPDQPAFLASPVYSGHPAPLWVPQLLPFLALSVGLTLRRQQDARGERASLDLPAPLPSSPPGHLGWDENRHLSADLHLNLLFPESAPSEKVTAPPTGGSIFFHTPHPIFGPSVGSTFKTLLSTPTASMPVPVTSISHLDLRGHLLCGPPASAFAP